jgi:predicted acyltransferase
MTNVQRMSELDILRGFAVAVMILVVSPGSWGHTYAPLRHADWHGWTFADLVFPDFLFGVGMALGLTFGRSLDPNEQTAFWTKVGRRVIGLTLLGLALNYLAVISGLLGAPPVGPQDYTTWRIPGVLQRIAAAYLIAVFIMWLSSVVAHREAPRPVQIGIAIAVLLIGTQHMWPLAAESWRGPVLYDPEGILATFPASANILFGVLAVSIWTKLGDRCIPALLVAGGLLIAAALLLEPLFPINKKIWTSTFALLTSGISFVALAAVATLLRAGMLPLLAPFRVLGGNAILAFSISIFLSAIAGIPLASVEDPPTLQSTGFRIMSAVFPDPHIASLACAFGIVLLIFLMIFPLHRRGIHIRL